MYRRIVPSLYFDVTDILQNGNLLKHLQQLYGSSCSDEIINEPIEWNICELLYWQVFVNVQYAATSPLMNVNSVSVNSETDLAI